MYIWDINSLVDQHKVGPLPQLEQFKYFFIGILSVSICSLIPSPIEIETPVLDFIESFCSLIVNSLGAYSIYRANKSGDNTELLSRYISLSIPITVRFGVFFVIGLIVNSAVSEIVFEIDTTSSNTVGDVVLVIFYEAAVNWYLYKKIAEISSFSSIE